MKLVFRNVEIVFDVMVIEFIVIICLCGIMWGSVVDSFEVMNCVKLLVISVLINSGMLLVLIVSIVLILVIRVSWLVLVLISIYC